MSAQRLGALRILLIDDNPKFQLLLQTVLAAIGVKYICAVDEIEPALLQLKDSPIDLIIVGWRLKGMANGIECIHRLRASHNAKTRQVPILMVTGYRESRLHEEARLAGADGVLTKPISARRLLDRLTTAVGRQVPPHQEPAMIQ